jgi:acyl-CoA thioesterase
MAIEKVKSYIEKKDMLIGLFGMEIVDFGSGYASVRMTVKENHVNAPGMCHGGTLFSLADVAFACASNSYGQLALAIEMSISFIKPVKPGETITAQCREIHRGRSLSRYMIEIRNEKNGLISLVKATSFIKENVPIPGST